MDGGSALPSGTAQPALPLAEALGRRNPDQRAPSPALAKEDVLYATRPKPPAQRIRATRSRKPPIRPARLLIKCFPINHNFPLQLFANPTQPAALRIVPLPAR